MTETSSLTTTYSIPNSYSVTAVPASVSPLPNGNLSPLVPDEEEYTIKCICGYNDDDGSTVFCEKCDTWQHIVCYYLDKKVPEIHFCTDCAPKDTFADINIDKARDRQRRARELIDGSGDRRVKRPASKSQKKKHRDTITSADQSQHPTVQPVNGWPQREERQTSLPNGKDQPPPAKKPKTSHRPSTSIASLNGESRKRAHSNLQSYPSPSKSPQEFRNPSIPRYTNEFLELYERDDGSDSATDNVHTIRGSSVLFAWKSSPSLIASHPEDAQNNRTPFVRADSDWSERKWPKVSVETMHKDVEADTKAPTWKLIRLESDVRKNTIIGEIRGQIGTLDEYCQQLMGPNRWKDLSHPDPFVFFHPYMDICIDSRKSGTQFRYIRRSCDPNVTIRSYITADDEVHHCFVANQDIPAGAELTASWYLGPQLRNVKDAPKDDKEQVIQETCELISKVLANFGDCACAGSKCLMDSWDRRSSMKSTDQPKPTAGRKKKLKTKQTLSPLSNGQPTTSRAGSETIKGPEEDEDHRSTSSSSGNGVRSRDLTPQGGALLDEPPMLGAGLTQREIRKIQAMEKAQKEQTQKTEKKQKKRPSGVSHQTTPVPTSRHHDGKRYSGSPPPARVLKDAGNLPVPPRQPSKQTRPVYVTASVQTDPEPEGEMPPLKRRKFCTPTQRLLKKLLHHRTQLQCAVTPTTKDAGNIVDVEMKDATTSMSASPSSNSSPSPTDDLFSPKAPLPSQAAHTHKVHGIFKVPAPRLNLNTLPPVPSFQSSTSASSSTTPVPLSTPPIAQSPGSTVANPMLQTVASSSAIVPSPVKKKLSLGDYMSRRKESSTPASEKPPAGPLTTPDEKEKDVDGTRKLSDASTSPQQLRDSARDTSVEEQAVDDTPMRDVSTETKVSDTEEAKTSPASVEVQGILSTLHEMHKRQVT